MKNTAIFKSLEELAPMKDPVPATAATLTIKVSPAPPGEDIRQELFLRQITPLVVRTPYHRWGLNE